MNVLDHGMMTAVESEANTPNTQEWQNEHRTHTRPFSNIQGYHCLSYLGYRFGLNKLNPLPTTKKVSTGDLLSFSSCKQTVNWRVDMPQSQIIS